MSKPITKIADSLPHHALIAATKSKGLEFNHKFELAKLGYEILKKGYNKSQAENFLNLCNESIATSVRARLGLN